MWLLDPMTSPPRSNGRASIELFEYLYFSVRKNYSTEGAWRREFERELTLSEHWGPSRRSGCQRRRRQSHKGPLKARHSRTHRHKTQREMRSTTRRRPSQWLQWRFAWSTSDNQRKGSVFVVVVVVVVCLCSGWFGFHLYYCHAQRGVSTILNISNPHRDSPLIDREKNGERSGNCHEIDSQIGHPCLVQLPWDNEISLKEKRVWECQQHHRGNCHAKKGQREDRGARSRFEHKLRDPLWDLSQPRNRSKNNPNKKKDKSHDLSGLSEGGENLTRGGWK